MSIRYAAPVALSTLNWTVCPWSTLNGVAKPCSASLGVVTSQTCHDVPGRQFSATTAFAGAAQGFGFEADAGASATLNAMKIATAIRALGRIARMGSQRRGQPDTRAAPNDCPYGYLALRWI